MKKQKLLKTVLISSATIGAAWAVNKAIFHYSTMRKMLSSEHGHIYKWRFGNIYYRKNGEGTPLLLVHDLSCDASGYEWKYVADELAKKHTVYVIDMIGCGHSDKPKITYTNYLYVQLLNEFIKEVIKGKTDVMTSGRASSLAVMACHMEPDLYNKLVFVNPPSVREAAKTPDFKSKLLKYALCMPVAGTFVYNMCFTKAMTAKRFEKKYISDGEKVRQADIEAYHEAAHLGKTASKYLYASILSHFTEVNIVRALKASDHSMFIIGGEKCENIKEIMEEYTMLNPAIEAVTVKDSRALIHVERPEKIVDNCAVFL